MAQTAKTGHPGTTIKANEWRKYAKHKYLVFMFIPAVIYYCIFHYGPLYGVQIAFKDYMFLKGIAASPWAGLKHFNTMISIPSFMEVMRNTVIISGYKLIFGFPAPILFAILISELRFLTFKKVVQTISYMPHFFSWVVLAGIFIQLLSPSSGPINQIIKSLGFEPIYFVASPQWFRTVLVVTSIWKGVGWGSIIYLAAITGINTEMYEAATIDGATRVQCIRFITLPSLIPVITIMLILQVGNIVQDDFDQIFNLYTPAVYRVGDVLSTYNYRRGVEGMEYSFSTAVGLFLNVISFSLTFIANAIAKKVNEYGIW